MTDMDTVIIGFVSQNQGCGLREIAEALVSAFPEDYERVISVASSSRNRANKILNRLVKWGDIERRSEDGKTSQYYTRW